MKQQTYDENGVLVYEEDIAEPPEMTRRQTIEDAARQALTSNRAFVASSPTAAQTAAQVKALSRQQNGIIRLLLGALDNTD